MRLSGTFPLLLVMAAVLCAGCFSDADFSVKSSSDFSPQSELTVSVVGVFKDGMMSAETWETVSPALSPALHGKSCDVAYGDAHVKKAPPLAQALDEYTRDNGITDELFAALAPAATGDAVMMITMAGRAQKPTSARDVLPSPLARGPFTSPQPAPIRAALTPAPRGSRAEKKSRGGLEMSASVFSRKTGHGVALISMLYTGTSEEEGIAMFARKLAAFIPNATCAPWKPDTEGLPTPEQVRGLQRPSE
jgi:hypothetical protein